MYDLSIIAASSFVRTALDELETVEEIGYLVDADAVNLNRLVTNTIVEAVAKTHLGAIPALLTGVQSVQQKANAEDTGKTDVEEQETPDFEAKLNEQVITITMSEDTLRVVSVHVEGSPVVCDIIPEHSAEGRKQLNRYVRGVADDPRVVICQEWSDSYKPVLKFYSTSEATCPKVTVEYIPYPVLTEAMVSISPRLEYAVLNEVTAMVLDSVNQHEKAALYRAKSQAIMKGE